MVNMYRERQQYLNKKVECNLTPCDFGRQMNGIPELNIQ